MQAYYDWLAWPVCGVKELDEDQKDEKGQLLIPQSRLFFAGEATHKDDAYTVQGALLSGGCAAWEWVDVWAQAMDGGWVQAQRRAGRVREREISTVPRQAEGGSSGGPQCSCVLPVSKSSASAWDPFLSGVGLPCSAADAATIGILLLRSCPQLLRSCPCGDHAAGMWHRAGFH